ncbi:hypothetical protein HY090_01740 [Candidatus Kaiserbacteria bacterium]|nr:hypothetical protein [Candidatus Kaiserbacteria bacterium]
MDRNQSSNESGETNNEAIVEALKEDIVKGNITIEEGLKIALGIKEERKKEKTPSDSDEQLSLPVDLEEVKKR